MTKHQQTVLFESSLSWCKGLTVDFITRHDLASLSDDLNQAARITLWKCVQRFDPKRGVSFQRFAYRRLQRALWCSFKTAGMTKPAPPRPAPTQSDPIAALESDEQAARYLKAIKSMKQRRAVELHCIEGLTFRQIGKRLRLSHSGAARLYHRGIERLRQQVTRRELA